MADKQKRIDFDALVKNAPNGITVGDLRDELYREVATPDGVYRIDSPVALFVRKGGTTLRILDAAGMVHLVPGPGYRGAAHRWAPRDLSNPVAF